MGDSLEDAVRGWSALRGVTATLQGVACCVVASPWYVWETVPLSAGVRVCVKWLERYPVLRATSPERAALRKFGYAAPVLLVYPAVQQGVMELILLCNVPLEGEVPRSVDVEPVEWRNYRLERVPKGPGFAWSWCLTPEVFAGYHHAVTETVLGRRGRNASDTLSGLFKHLSRYPGFAGINRQRGELVRYAGKLWTKHQARHLRDGEPAPLYDVPTYPYLRRITWYAHSLGEVLEDARGVHTVGSGVSPVQGALHSSYDSEP